MGYGWRSSLALVLVLTGVGCSSSSSGSSSGSSGGSSGSSGTSGTTSGLERLCNDFGDTVCQLEPRCQIGELPSNCKDIFVQGCIDSSQQAIADGRQKLRDVAQYEAICSGAGQAQFDCVPGVDFFAFLFCSQVTQGNVAMGGACHVSGDCTDLPDGGNVACVAPADTCGGVCKSGAGIGEACGAVNGAYLSCNEGYCLYSPPLPDGTPQPSYCAAYATLGQSCGQGAQCSPETACGYATQPPTCVARTGAGTPCEGDSCTADAYCVNTDGGFTDRTCHPRSAAGGPCDPNHYDSCMTNAQCVSGPNVCAPSSAALGGACHHNYTSCPDHSTCTGEDSTHLGTCAATDGGQPTGLGSPCSAPDGDETSCGSPGDSASYVCKSGKCVARPGDGQPCTASGKCLFGDHCVAGVCHRQPQLGQACVPTHSKDCFEGYCDQTSHVCTALKSAGAACDPANFECVGRSSDCTSYVDGGSTCIDGSCRSSDGGAPVCSTHCN